MKNLPVEGDIVHWKHPDEQCVVFIVCRLDTVGNGVYVCDVLWSHPSNKNTMQFIPRWYFDGFNKDMWEVLDDWQAESAEAV